MFLTRTVTSLTRNSGFDSLFVQMTMVNWQKARVTAEAALRARPVKEDTQAAKESALFCLRLTRSYIKLTSLRKVRPSEFHEVCRSGAARHCTNPCPRMMAGPHAPVKLCRSDAASLILNGLHFARVPLNRDAFLLRFEIRSQVVEYVADSSRRRKLQRVRVAGAEKLVALFMTRRTRLFIGPSEFTLYGVRDNWRLPFTVTANQQYQQPDQRHQDAQCCIPS